MQVYKSNGAMSFILLSRASCRDLSSSVTSISAVVGSFAEVRECDDRPPHLVPNFFLGCLDSAACDKGRCLGSAALDVSWPILESGEKPSAPASKNYIRPHIPRLCFIPFPLCFSSLRASGHFELLQRGLANSLHQG